MSKTYSIKEMHYTIQGEGAQSGRPAVFVRFSGCNLWTGREVDRHKAICQFCDTDFWGTDGIGGGKYTAEELSDRILDLWPDTAFPPFVVCTGGEPLLQLDEPLIKVLHQHDMIIAIETNGTQPVPNGIDWVCMSPKARTEIVVKTGDEIKIVHPQPGIKPSDFDHLDFTHFFIQPMDNENQSANINQCVEFCKANPKWRLSFQIHKAIGVA